MFIIKLFINENQIKEIRVRKTTKRTIIGDYFYEIEKPKLGQTKVVHDLDAGALTLAIKTLSLVKEQERRFPEEEEDD